jgi:hypothetical protein
MREDEVVNGTITYSLPLSAQPTKPVIVTVMPSDQSQSDCVVYENGLKLVDNIFEFTTMNYNVSQHVVVSVQRLKNTNQGSAGMSFVHSIASDDVIWGSAFLRPALLTLVDDPPCALGAQLFDDVFNGVRKCGCSSGTWIDSIDPQFCESVLSCTPCPDGLDCGFQQALQNATVQKEKYRLTESSLSVVGCVRP